MRKLSKGSLAQRLRQKSRSGPGGCRLWTASLDRRGYGQIVWKGKNHRAHRMAWIAKHGSIPKGLCVLHHCDVPRCINIDHLWLGTKSDNAQDMVAKGRGRNGNRKGAEIGNAKLTDRKARAIFKAIGPQRWLAQRFGVSQPIIGRIKRKEAWKHIHLCM